MAEVDLSKPGKSNFPPVPADEYLCEVVDVEKKFTTKGDEMWRVRFQIVEGSYAGQSIWDNIVFSEAAHDRARLIFSRLGVELREGVFDYQPRHIEGKRVFITVELEDYEGKPQNTVPFAGYRKVETEEESVKPPTEEEEDLPF